MNPPNGTSQTPPVGNGPVMLDRASAERVADATRYYESMVRGRDRTSPPRLGGVNAFQLAVTTSTVGPGTATTPGTGTAAFQRFNGASVSADADTTTVYNYHDKTVATGKLVLLAWVQGYWFVVDVRSCGDLS